MKTVIIFFTVLLGVPTYIGLLWAMWGMLFDMAGKPFCG